ncbi:MAG: hypothetical protein KAS76_00610 [Thermoplasmatales archaeon]|nr:hypothetical protein [Thermoplasmatales archaeon]
MTNCVECGQKLGLFGGFRHPTMGRQHLVCSHCYDNVNESVTQWREFILPYANYFRNTPPKETKHYNFENFSKQVAHAFRMPNRS